MRACFCGATTLSTGLNAATGLCRWAKTRPQTRIGNAYSTWPTCLPKVSSVREMQSTWKPLCFRLKAAMPGEWLVSAFLFLVFHLVFVLFPPWLTFRCRVYSCREISGFRKTSLPYLNEEDRGDGARGRHLSIRKLENRPITNIVKHKQKNYIRYFVYYILTFIHIHMHHQ
jgi:hypothetical protein